jgi:hypothetical protein
VCTGSDAGADASAHDASAPDASAPDAPPPADAPALPDAPSDGAAPDARTPSYDDLVLADHPVGYWAMAHAGGTEPDLSGGGNAGTYRGGTPAPSALPNGDVAARFDGATQYLTVPSRAAYSIPTTGDLTWEAWLSADALEFPHNSNGYVSWMGKCAVYAPTCEWEARMYTTTNPQNRCNRFSAYAFNPSAGLGSGADWQPVCGLIAAARWYHVVGEYTTRSQPASCANVAQYPGSLNIWVDGVPWNQARHAPTGCMSQYSVIPAANNSPINIGSMAQDSWFPGAIGKVAVYDYLLPQARISAHYRAMTGGDPAGSCADTCTLM